MGFLWLEAESRLTSGDLKDGHLHQRQVFALGT